jgi:hypothetical protein
MMECTSGFVELCASELPVDAGIEAIEVPKKAPETARRSSSDAIHQRHGQPPTAEGREEANNGIGRKE